MIINKLFFALSSIAPGKILPKIQANQASLQIVLQIFFGLAGALAVLFVVLGGLRYIISKGDPQGASKAKKTIIYAVVGIAVALSGEAIVTWVLLQA